MIVIGVGNRWRGDDAAGLAVADRVRELAGGTIATRTHEDEASGLVDAWEGAARAVVVDAATSGAPAGTVHRFAAATDPLPANRLRSSTHAFGVPDAIELARALGRLPERLDVYAIEGAEFAVGAALTPTVARAVEDVARELVLAARTG